MESNITTEVPRYIDRWIFVKRVGRLVGIIYNDDRFDDGDCITTTPIKSLEGTTVTTRSGTIYNLGESIESSLDDIKEYLNKDKG